MIDATAARIWGELLAGEWVVVERRDSSLRRTLLLRRSTDAERLSRAFTALERDVLVFAMRAWSLKMMAAELGLSTSRVAEVLGRVRSKVGAPTQADLLRMVGSFGIPVGGTVPGKLLSRPAHPPSREKSLHKRNLMASAPRL